VVSVISEWRTASSRTFTASPRTPRPRSSSATGPRWRAHQSSSASARLRTAITFSIEPNIRGGRRLSASWVEHAIWWQVYPLGFVGAFPPRGSPGPDEHRLRRLADWFDHAIELGASGVALGPIFASRTHGYDTTDHYRIDPRLGADADFDHLIAEARARGLRILLDGVFNHVGRDFRQYREAAPGWFRGRPGRLHTFEGHAELVTLNHDNPAVVDYTVDVMSHWLGRGADGWRLDAAYAVPQSFWAAVLPRVRERHPDAWFVGELIHGDYAGVVDGAGFDSATQYELWKAIWSSL